MKIIDFFGLFFLLLFFFCGCSKPISKADLEKQIIAANPGISSANINIFSVESDQSNPLQLNGKIREDDNYNAVQINSAAFLNPQALYSAPVIFLSFIDTSLPDLLFLEDSGTMRRNLKILFLENNRKMNYDALKSLSIETLQIMNSANFKDTSHLPQTLKNIVIINSGIKKLEFKNLSAIENLCLLGNQKLTDCRQINEMHNLQSLTISETDGIDFSRLKKLKSLGLESVSMDTFPAIPQNSVDFISLNHCNMISSIDHLKNKKITTMWIINSNIQPLLNTLSELEIDNLLVIDENPADNLKILSENKFIKSLKINREKIR